MTTAVTLAAALFAFGCGGATKGASPQAPGKAALTGAKLGVRYDRVLVAEKGAITMVARGGCAATVSSGMDATGPFEEMRVRCPQPDRLTSWFAAVDKITSTLPVEAVEDDDDTPATLPAAELVTAKGDVLAVKAKGDAERLVSEVRALTAELASAEVPSPGPQSPNGWQLLRVSGPAHVFLGGSPATGVLDARMSTSGQYLCEFVANAKGNPIRATKSGWIKPATAARAIDEVLTPFADVGSAERRPATFASAIQAGAEKRANAASTAAVFERFAHVQDALGDACLPELDPPAPIGL